ncbi:MAG: hypothetical protein JWL76_1477 [Thermoleophilia bacterium]|nr:hypothetical protein [Thermoleophilia bacterium]
MTNLAETMLPDLWAALDRIHYDDDVDFLWIESVEPSGDTATITFELCPYNTDLKIDPARWKIIAKGVVRVTVDTLGGPGPDLSVSNHDVALWPFTEKLEALYFTGSADDPNKLAGDLLDAHRVTVHERTDELPFALHLPADKLFAGGGGLLYEGPARIVSAYEDVLRAHKLKPSRLPKTNGYAYWDPMADEYVTASDSLVVGRFGFVQVIAEGFRAEPLSSGGS